MPVTLHQGQKKAPLRPANPFPETERRLLDASNGIPFAMWPSASDGDYVCKATKATKSFAEGGAYRGG
jgi:hypothetical protein